MQSVSGSSTSSTLIELLCAHQVNESAWAMFFARYRPMIRSWCRLAGLRAADIDEVESRVLYQCVAAMKSFRYDPTLRFRGWLKTVVLNAIRSYWREHQRRPGGVGSGDSAVLNHLQQIELKTPLDPLADEMDTALYHELRLLENLLLAVQQRVAENTWQAFWLTTMKGLSAQEAAQRIQMKVAHVYVAKHRVIRMLKDTMNSVLDATGEDTNESGSALSGN